MMLHTKQTIYKCPYASHILTPPDVVHQSTFFVISLVEKGEAEIEFFSSDEKKSKTIVVDENCCFINFPFRSIIYKRYSNNFSFRNIFVDERTMFECCNFLKEGSYDDLLNLEFPPAFHLSPPSVIYFAEITSSLMKEKKTEKMDSIHKALVCDFLALYRIRKSANAVFPKWINALLRKLEDKDFLSLSVEKMVRTTNYSHGYVNREFKKYLGCSIKQYIIRKRLGVATVLLTTTDQSVEEISDHLNFSTVSNFINTFKKRYHITPAKYRKLYGSLIQLDTYQEWGDTLETD